MPYLREQMGGIGIIKARCCTAGIGERIGAHWRPET
jgi:hypothetical protein